MADTSIGNLTAATSVTGVDLIPVVQGGVTKRATVSQLPSLGGGGSGGGGAPYVIDGGNPPTGSGLTAVTADGSTDNASRIQAGLNYVKSTFGAGVYQLPPTPSANIKVQSGLTVPAGVTLRGVGKAQTTLDFSGAGSSTVAVTSSGDNTFPVADLRLLGPNTGDKLGYPTNTCAGINLSGVTVRVERVRIEKFFYGVDSTNSNSFFHTLVDVQIGNAGVCWDLSGDATHNGGNVPSEFGERMGLIDSTFYNSQLGFDVNQSGVRLYALNCSFDYLGAVGKVINGFVEMTNCHLETGYAPTNSGNWGAINRYMFSPAYEARMSFANCDFEIRDAGVYQVCDPTAGPAVYNSGYVEFTNCSWYGAMPGATPGSDPQGSQRQFRSRDMISFPNDSSTQLTTQSPFGTKWNMIRAYQVATDAGSTVGGWAFRVVSSAVSSVAGAIPSQNIVIERIPPAGASTPYPQMWVCVEY